MNAMTMIFCFSTVNIIIQNYLVINIYKILFNLNFNFLKL